MKNNEPIEIGFIQPAPHESEDKTPVCSLIEATKQEWNQLIKPLGRQRNDSTVVVEAGFLDEPLLDDLLDRPKQPSNYNKIFSMRRVVTLLDE
jgi:hypothetical protein